MQITIDTNADSPDLIAHISNALSLFYAGDGQAGAVEEVDKEFLKDLQADAEAALDAVDAPREEPAPAAVFRKPATVIASAPLDAVIPAPVAPTTEAPPVPLASPTPPAVSGAVAVPLSSLAPIVPAPPMPATSAPSAAIPALASAGIELDVDGKPWDATLHASTKTKTIDGRWKAKRGASAAVVVPTGTPPAAPIAPPPVPLPGNTSVPFAAPSVPAGSVSFRDVMAKVTTGQAAGKLTKADVDAALAQLGFKPDELAPLVLPANATLLQAFNQLIDTKLAA